MLVPVYLTGLIGFVAVPVGAPADLIDLFAVQGYVRLVNFTDLHHYWKLARRHIHRNI